MIDLSIIKLMMKKENLDKFGGIVYSITVEPEIHKILISINKYYEEYINHSYLSVDELELYFFTNYPSQKNNQTFQSIFDKLRSLEVSDSLARDLVLRFLEKDMAGELVKLVMPAMTGDGSGVLQMVPELIDKYKQKAHLVDAEIDPFISDDPELLMGLIDKSGGLKWGLNHLNQNIRSLPAGTLGHIFARVETGKTTFIASQVAHFVGQLDETKNVLWVCNEEHGNFVKLRTYQSLLNLSSDEIAEYIRARGKEDLLERYKEAGGSKIKIHYDPNVSIEGIKTLLEKTPGVRVMIVDIADHVSFRGESDLTGPGRLGELYRRYRALASKYEIDIITVGQASAECDGKKVLHMDHMHNSRTDKPGALDYAIGIGKTYDESTKDLRWLTICKNKIGSTERETDVVNIDTMRGRMYDA